VSKSLLEWALVGGLSGLGVSWTWLAGHLATLVV
jgi:hypothetical protein